MKKKNNKKKNSTFPGFQEFLSKDANETSNKSTLVLHILCGSGIELSGEI